MQRSSSNRQSTFVDVADDDELVKDEDQRALLEAENGLQQFDEVLRIAERSLSQKRIDLTSELIANLNNLAVQNIRRSAG